MSNIFDYIITPTGKHRDMCTENDTVNNSTANACFRIDKINRFSIYIFMPIRYEPDGDSAENLAKALVSYI